MRILRYDGPGVVRLAFHGELDLATTDLVDTYVSAALAGEDVRRLVLDVAGLTFCDSAGIDALLAARAGAASRDVAFQVVGARGIVRRSMAATGVLALLTAA
ncbi:STAS domain-containing protein [Actinoplanes siamensis]|uniref:Anti-sigma factor antagonist n=1 Tax=Actinoplanes siamensis TaxID=1223317 RepID=A0A919N7B8_9ACTN|nr:STAS domain-containing protein [Actinoplanes siamensis]GIF05672.1 hypothetical protein Asi03nite_32100 [Actinoplanes siamensis]